MSVPTFKATVVDTFDDERSIKAKAKYVRPKKLCGVMFWELTADKKTDGLVDAISWHLN